MLIKKERENKTNMQAAFLYNQMSFTLFVVMLLLLGAGWIIIEFRWQQQNKNEKKGEKVGGERGGWY